jgi:hypothetical protein
MQCNAPADVSITAAVIISAVTDTATQKNEVETLLVGVFQPA